MIFNAEGQVLMLLRSDNDCWCFPGGAIELGEKVEDAARREVFEETGLEVIELELYNVFSGEELYYKYPHGDEVYNVDIVYRSSNYKGNLTVNEESRRARFFDLEAIPDNISPPVIPIVQDLLTKIHR
ncbi:NUDIX domain-containing protein [Paenibacillus sp. N5-1-1-5]|uniref:NUDIX domain-containing protein n=2 Tax=Paenibacillus radicis (ex Xue et al. 2023) TaxID=2972489 RepID=A0ABT1YK64_9BACL|nr:NUDIX domain-containing protein [Paenibacillus radicis (ex Xue et al. 2023)]